MSDIGKIIRVNALPPVESREKNVIYQVAAPGAATYTDYAIDINGDLKTHAVVDGTVPLELADSHISITNQEFIAEGIASQAQYNVDTREKLEQKLEIPTTEGNAQDYPKIIGLDDNGNIAKLPAGDLGKNMMNADLSNSSARNHTLHAPFSINTLGNSYTVVGLPNKNSDTTNFNKVVVQNVNGINAVIDSKNMMVGIPNQMTEAERTAWKTAMNGGWTTNTMSVANVFPNIVKSVNYGVFVTINGANLNINPSSSVISLVNNISGVEKVIPNSQITYGDANLISIWFKPNTFTDGEYRIKIFNGVAIIQTSGLNNILITSNANSVDINALTWDKIAHTQSEVDNVMQINGSNIDFVTNAANKPLATDFSIVSSAKSSQIFTGADNFSLKGYMILTGNINLYGGGLIGLVNANNNNSLIIDALASLKITIEGGNWADLKKSINEQSSVPLYSIPNFNQVRVDFVISKRDNMISMSLNHNTAYNNTIQIYQTVQKTIPEGIPLSIGLKGLNANSPSVKVKTVLEEAYKF
ncbi:hypothetical protein A0O34_08320 [Chryseobacterium glaciei]|uniref:Uncharacterized protein n=1 Tax=Chryseobacterium glaciei TaxID=1685010 RepID=A0A172XUB1_9FLAO|nr:hypothetical protein [Chryseobacterium glaciei]ANF50524.1 hypothetical protein A0O34_08320 [Chryseobacterium glaciei]